MSEIEKRLREHRKVSRDKFMLENSLYKVGDRVKIATDTEDYVEVAEVLGIEEVGLYRVKVGDTEHVIEEIYLKPIEDLGLTDRADTEIPESKKNLLRAIHKPMTTADRPNISEGESYKIMYQRDLLPLSDDRDPTATVLVHGAKDEDDAIQKAIDKVTKQSELADLNPRNFRIVHKLGDTKLPDEEEPEETFDDLIIGESKKVNEEYEVVGTLAQDEIDSRYLDLRSDLKGMTRNSVIGLINEIESRGFLVSTYTDEFIIVTDLEDQRPAPSEHMIPLKWALDSSWVKVRD